LKPRREDGQGVPRWHDVVRLQLALDAMMAGKPLARNVVWMGLARKLQIAQAEAGWPGQVNMEVRVELEDGEAKLLWEELWKLPPEAMRKNPFTGQAEVPDAATLGEMLEEWGEALGEEAPS